VSIGGGERDNCGGFQRWKSGKMKELEYIKRVAKEIQVGKEFLEGGENDKLRLEVFDVEQTHSLSEVEVHMHNMEFGVLDETNVLDAKSAQVMKESDHLKREAVEINTNKDLVGDKNYTPLAKTFDDIVEI
jgi:NAD-specific glutamate dehydrogenase